MDEEKLGCKSNLNLKRQMGERQRATREPLLVMKGF
jgi:hypothetical protein